MRNLLIITLLFLSNLLFAQNCIIPNTIQIKYSCFTSYFSNECRIPLAVEILATKYMVLHDSLPRNFKFTNDSNVPRSAKTTEYTNSQNDRGHNLDAELSSFNFKCETDAFKTTNIAPQKKSFNEKSWRLMEQYCRDNVVKVYDSTYIVIGTIVPKTGIEYVNKDICIPSYFYRVLYIKKTNSLICLIGLNQETNGVISNISLSDLEKLSGYTFLINNINSKTKVINIDDKTLTGWNKFFK